MVRIVFSLVGHYKRDNMLIVAKVLGVKVMSQLNCLNLCEIIHHLYELIPDFQEIITKANEIAGFDKCERIYIGSYFCGQYFLHQSKEMLDELRGFCEKEGVALTLVVPTFSEKDLERGKEKLATIKEWLGKIIDEVVVNDYGMLAYVSDRYHVSLHLGRLFTKDYRDPRYEEYFNQVLSPKIFNKYMLELVKAFKVKGVEFDPTHVGINFREAPEELIVGIHGPYCYMTTGHICEYASLNKEIDKKFRPNNPCTHECSSHIISYDLEDDREWLRIGKTIYFENRECSIYELEHMRMIYFPIDLEVGK